MLHCSSTTLTPIGLFAVRFRQENKLEYMAIYQRFTEMFNSRIEGFITQNGSTLEEFVKACEAAEGEESFALQLIMSITSFEAFKVRVANASRCCSTSSDHSLMRLVVICCRCAGADGPREGEACDGCAVNRKITEWKQINAHAMCPLRFRSP